MTGQLRFTCASCGAERVATHRQIEEARNDRARLAATPEEGIAALVATPHHLLADIEFCSSCAKLEKCEVFNAVC